MTTQEKLLAILAEGWEIKIYARGCPFSVGYSATKGDQNISDINNTFDDYINMVYVVLAGEKDSLHTYQPGDLSKAFEGFCVEGEISKDRLDKLVVK